MVGQVVAHMNAHCKECVPQTT